MLGQRRRPVLVLLPPACRQQSSGTAARHYLACCGRCGVTVDRCPVCAMPRVMSDTGRITWPCGHVAPILPARTTTPYPGLVGPTRRPRLPGRLRELHCIAVVLAVEGGGAIALDSHNPGSWMPAIFAAGFTALWIKATRSWIRGDT